MKTLNKILFLVVVSGVVGACGVKSRPLPPLLPPPLGRGEPTQSPGIKEGQTLNVAPTSLDEWEEEGQ